VFFYIYLLLSTILYIVALPYLLYKIRIKKYSKAIPAKFFLRNNSKFEENKIWFHTCSMGETQAIKPLVDVLDDEVNLSVITNTGFQKALQLSSNVRYLPYEIFLPFWIVKQKALVVVEAELWYMLFLCAKNKNIPTYLINARISDKSYNSYKKFTWFYTKIFKNIDKIFAQSDIDKQRLEKLGAKNIKVIGNIKLATLPKITNRYKKQNTTIITAGSTHESEEELILNAWDKSMGKLILAPRHPERFNSVFNMIQNKYENTNISFHKLSSQNNFLSDIILIDMMGMLNNIYEISDVVILGGSFIKKAGGHNPIEPAFYKTKLISGKTIFNQKSLFECVNNYYLISNNQLKEYLNNIKNLKKSSIGQKSNIEPILKELEKL
jgi:3-deoxy-D-manno-octulosonic-acid transferase